MYYCRVVKPGIFAVGAILAVISLIVGIFYYVTLNSKANASLPNQGGIVMVQPQFPQENPGFVHGYTYSKGKKPFRGIIEVLVQGKHIEWVSSNLKWKAHMGSVLSTSTTIKKPKPSLWDLRFSERDKNGILDVEGENPLVVLANNLFFQVKRIMVDTSSSVDILTAEAFYQMRLKDM
ncbi:hypothetical protein Goarm_012086 [Gossypium armourianum]|uniref:Uncharacterized protein n=2 Tax=Gossypium TaxID=3633 RepID=A0A7J9IYW0_9ROSI|nr:hypothetical protein [Gossypium armourianum]